MGSIRRTLSPYHHRHHHSNGNSSHKQLRSPFAATATRKSSSSYRSRITTLLFICFLFFLLGFLLGLAPPFQQQHHKINYDFDPPNTVIIDNKSIQQNPLYNTHNKQLIIVTPTYNRPLQAFYLNRLAHLLSLVPPPLLWIVVEMNAASTQTANILRGMGIMYRHLVSSNNLTNIKDRGVHQRNTALEHIQHHRLDGIVYFADDDNVYSLQLFDALRDIRRFGTWPVAMLAQSKNKATLEGPVCNGTQVIGWHTNEKSKRLRRFHVDMSGFAFNSTILWDPNKWNKTSSASIRQLDTVKEGFQETTFIEQLVEDESQMEAIPSGCSKIMNWHLHLESHQVFYPRGWLLQKNLDAVLPID